MHASRHRRTRRARSRGDRRPRAACVVRARVRVRDMRVLYVVMLNNMSGMWDSSIRAQALYRGWLGGVSPADVWLHGITHPLYSHNRTNETGALYFDAIGGAVASRGVADWYMLCDDDTHVDILALDQFVQNASTEKVYGNVYDRGRASHCYGKKGYFRLKGGWPTGGSGVLVPGPVARKLTNRARIAQWARIAKTCRCIDRPLACALGDLGYTRTKHLPHLFLDSCLYCADFLKPRRIISCHAASVFRSHNRYATDKRTTDFRAVNGSFAFRIGAHGGKSPFKYSWPTLATSPKTGWAADRTLAQLRNVSVVERMRAVQLVLCPPMTTPPVEATSYCSPLRSTTACLPG